MGAILKKSRSENLSSAVPIGAFPLLRKKNLPFGDLLDFAAESVLIVDRDGRIVWANRKTEELFGYPRNELMGQLVEVLLPERLREAHLEKRKAYLLEPRNRAMGKGMNLRARRRDGSEFSVEISLSHAGAGEDLLIMALVSDITVRRRMEEALEQSEEFNRERVRRLEEELHRLERLARPPTSAVTARHFGLLPLREQAPHLFEEMVEEYHRLLDLALEARIYKTENKISEKLHALAARLGFLKADPRDVVDIHTAALRKKGEETAAPKVRGYVEEGHLLLVELMGYVASYYQKLTYRPGKGATGPSGH